jgi:dTDP-4-dehydrorhamnose reductase
MTTAESTPYYSELTASMLRTRDEITTDMLAIALPGQDQLDELTLRKLRHLTTQLRQVEGEQAEAEFDRYGDVSERGLDINRDALSEHISGKSVLVTGGTGLIGSALLSELATFGAAQLTSLSRGITRPVQINPAVKYLLGDIRNENDVQAAFGATKPDIVFHVAADKYNHEAEARAKFTLTTNIEGTMNILRAAKSNGIGQIVYASTGKATRPYSPDIYASSKKAGEWLMTSAAESGLLSSAVRFTHVVDDSNVRKKINERIDASQHVKLQSPDILFYIQSAKESAHLLLNSLLEAQPGILNVQAIRDLAMPVSLLHLGLGAIAKKDSDVAIYFGGVEEGYEDKAWPGLYDPMTGGDVSPLINAIEAPEAEESKFCYAIDTFPLKIAKSHEANKLLKVLLDACHEVSDNGMLRELNQALGWAMLDARLNALPWATLSRTASRVAMLATTEALTEEHIRTGEAITEVMHSRVSIVV